MPDPRSDARPVVRYDAETYARALQQELDALLLSLQQPAWREATGERWLAHLVRDLDGARARLRQPFVLLVVGDFKRGKSTLINALLGRALVTMDVAPETVVVTELTWGPAVRVEARLQDGGRVDLREDDLPSARLGPLLENLPGPVDVVRIEAPVDVLQGVVIVDSPGTGDLMWRFDRRVQEYLPRADAVLHVVSAISPMSDTERGFLRLALRPLDLPKVMFVVNQLDLIRAAGDIGRVVARVAESIEPLFPDSPVLGVSALHALARATGDELPRPEQAEALDAAMAELRTQLNRRVLAHRDIVRNERGAYEAEAVLARAADELKRLQQRLESNRGEVRDALARARDEGSAARRGVSDRDKRIRSRILELGEQAVAWMGALVGRIEHEALPQLAEVPYEEAQRHFPFFLAETLRDGLAACMDAHQDTVLALVEEVSAEAARELDAALGSGGQRAVDRVAARAGFQTPAWTVFDHIHSLALVLNALTAGLASVFAGLLDRGAGAQARAENFRGAVARAMPELGAEVARATRGAYGDLAEAVCARLRTSAEEELARIEAELEQAVAVHDRGVERLQDTSAALAAAVARIDEAREAVDALRGRLVSAAEAR